MIVLITVVAVIVTVTVIATICGSWNSTSRSNNLARAICGKLVGIGSVNSLDDIRHITDIT